MRRIFYCDYGEDPARRIRIESMLRHLKENGAEVCRTSRRPVVSVAQTLPLPWMLTQSPRKYNLSVNLTAYGESDPLLALCAAIYHYDHSGRSMRDCLNSMQSYRFYIEEELAQFSPDLAILWHQFNPYSYFVNDWCERHGVPVLYGEHGVLPGSWCFEFGGQMGESWISRDPAKFAALPVTRSDRERAEAYLAQAVHQRMNRKTDTISVTEAGLAQELRSDPRPKILYAGVNDYKTGLQPFSPERTGLHTGDFISSETGLNALLPLARRNGWQILFKPHPSIKHDSAGLATHSDYLKVIDKRVDLVDLIGYSDVLATIVSQSAYMSLMHGTPTVLMGRLQLSGSGLVHEAPYRGALENALHTALAETAPDTRDAATSARRDGLIQHIARLLRYYVISAEYGKRGLFHYDLSDLANSLLHTGAINTDTPLNA